MTEILYSILIFSFYRLHSKTLTYRFSKKTIFPAYIIAFFLFIVTGYISKWLPNIPLKFFVLILLMFYLILLHKDSWWKRIFFVLFPTFIYALCELLVIFVMSFFLGSDNSTLVSATTQQRVAIFFAESMFLILIELFIRYKSNDDSIFNSFRTELLLMLSINIAFIFIISGLFYYNNFFLTTKTTLNIALFSIVLISGISIFTLYKIAKKSKETMETNLKLQQIEMEHKLTEDLADVVNNLRSLRHDMNNHMNILQGLLSLEEYQEATNYLNSISSELSVANQFIFVENKVLSVLINSKIDKASTLGIPIETEILVNDFPLNEKDLCALIGNILENAIEAAKQAKSPNITFSIKKENHQLCILCENTFLVTPIVQNGEFITTKAEKQYHGIGTKNIKSIVKKYQGQTDFFFDELFRVSIVIPY